MTGWAHTPGVAKLTSGTTSPSLDDACTGHAATSSGGGYTHAGEFRVPGALLAAPPEVVTHSTLSIILCGCLLSTVAWSPDSPARSSVEHPLINRTGKSPGGQDALVRPPAQVGPQRIGPSTSITDGGGWVRWTPVQTAEPGHGRSWQGPRDPLHHNERGAVAHISSVAGASDGDGVLSHIQVTEQGDEPDR